MARLPAPPPDGTLFAYPPHPITGERAPNPRQALAHQCPAGVLFYGGVRGGGKTEFLGTEAGVHALNHAGIQMLLVRRTREEMKANILPVFTRIFRDVARWSKSDHTYLFFNGSTLIVDFMQQEEDIGRYLGAEFGWIGVDQAEQLTEFTVAGLLSCVRTTRPWPKKMRLTGNPGLGVGVPWLRRWFIKPVAAELGGRRPPKTEELWRPLPKPGDPSPPEHVPTRCFIPARFEDNTALVAADPTYKARIYQAFTPQIARAQAEGDWEASDATIVGPLWAESKTVDADLVARYPEQLRFGQLIDWHVIHNGRWRPPKGALIYGSVDYGYGVPWAFHLHAALPGGHTRTFYERYGVGVRDAEQARQIQQALTTLTFTDGKTPLFEGLQWIVYDPSMKGSRKEQGLAKSIIEVYHDECPRVAFLQGAAGRSARMSRPNRWIDALTTAADGFPWWSVTTACPELIRTVPEVPRDPDDPDVEDDASENHCYEDTGRFFEARPHAPRVAPPDPYAGLDPISAEHHRAMDAKRAKHRGGHLGGLGKH
jgi:phage terminase large subunit